MFFVLSKFLQPLLWPFNLSLALVTGALVCFFTRRPRWGVRLLTAGWALGVLCSLPLVGGGFVESLESRYQVIGFNDVPEADALVVLGGTVVGLMPPRVFVEEFGGSRLVPAAQLYHAGKARQILVSSGARYRLPDGEWRGETQDMRVLLEGLGVPSHVIIEETQSRNTDENARYSIELMQQHGVNSFVLVTSAFHMPRSAAMFKKHGAQDFTAFPTERRARQGTLSFNSFIPDAGSLGLTTLALKEYVGWWVYQLAI